MFGSIDSEYWILKIELSIARKHQIRESFCYASVEFHYPNDLAEFETILELLKDNKSDVNIENNDFDELGGVGENDVFDRLIVMDDVSGLADKSNEFCNTSKILTSNCERETLKYIPKRELWINRLYFEIANRKDYSCLTIDCGKSGPSKYRREADNNVQQTCFLVKRKKIGYLTDLLRII